MRIWVCYIYESIRELDAGGGRYRFGELCRALVRRGHDVTWWQSGFRHQEKNFRFQESRTIEIADRFRIRLARGIGYQRNVSFRRIFHNRAVAAQIRLWMDLEEIRPDVIVVGLPCLEVAGVAAAYAERFQVPLIVDAHDMWPDVYLRAFPSLMRPIARAALWPVFRSARTVFRKAAGFSAVSQTYLDWIVRFSGRPRGPMDAVFPLGYAIPDGGGASFSVIAERYNIPTGKMFAVFVGTFGRFYDLECVVAAARLAQKENLGLHFVLIGSGDDAAKIRHRCLSLRNVTLTGWLDPGAIWTILSNATVAVACYRSEATQSLPYKPFEYMAAGLVQVNSLKGEMRRLLEEERIGFYYNAGCANELLERICWVCENGEMRENMSARASALYRNKYRMDKIYDDMAQYVVRAGRGNASD